MTALLASWTEGYRPKISAAAAYDAIVRIAEEHGLVDPLNMPREILLNEAQSEESPFYTMIEWNDATAAHRYRLGQCNRILSSLRIVEHPGEESQPAFISMRVEGPGQKRTYVSSVSVRNDFDLRRSFLLQETKDISELLRRTDTFAEMAPIRAAVKKVRSNLERQEVLATAAD